MALRPALAVVAATVLALTLCGCGASSTPPAPGGGGSNKPEALLPGAQNPSGPNKGKFFTKQGGTTTTGTTGQSNQPGVNN